MLARSAVTGSMLVLAASLGLGAPATAADVYELDPGHTDIVFMVSHFGYSDTIGRFNEAQGTIVMDDQDLAGSSIELVIDAASIDTNHAKRDEHLRSPDFFNVAEYPTITFESTGIEKTGEDTAEVAGDLTMHGVTRPVTLDVTLNKVAPHPVPSYEGVMTAGFSARGTIRRSDFGIDMFTPAIGDEVDVIIEIEALRQNQRES